MCIIWVWRTNIDASQPETIINIFKLYVVLKIHCIIKSIFGDREKSSTCVRIAGRLWRVWACHVIIITDNVMCRTIKTLCLEINILVKCQYLLAHAAYALVFVTQRLEDYSYVIQSTRLFFCFSQCLTPPQYLISLTLNSLEIIFN